MAFKDRLRQLREDRGITQKQCAEELSVSYDNYNKWENGSSPNFDTLVKIANFFNVTIDYLLGASDTKKPENDDINKRLGLSDKAIYALEELHKNDPGNPLTMAVNALLENLAVLWESCGS